MRNLKFWFIRNWHLIFNKSKCFKIEFFNNKYFATGNVVVFSNGKTAKCLGNKWLIELPYKGGIDPYELKS